MKFKEPPRATEIEKSVLASMFLHPDDRSEALGALIDEDFYHSSHQILFSKIRELHEAGNPVELDTVYEALSDEEKEKIKSAAYLASLLDKTPASVDLNYHISILKDRSTKRRTIELINSIEKKCYRGNGDLRDILTHTQLIIDEVKKAESVKDTSFQFIHNSQIIENLTPVEWRIRDILEDKSFYYNFGDAASYKTFVELDRLLHIATGINYHDHPVKQGTVFYVAGEGQQGIGRRIAAWHIAYKAKRDIPFFLAKTPTQLMDINAVDDVKRAVDMLAAEYGLPAIIHIDTLARNFGEGDENATKDMNRVISNLDLAFGNDFGRGLTHHSGHSNKDRARGSYALHCAADAAFRVEYRIDGKVLVEAKKSKDSPLAAPMLFNRKEIKLTIGNQYDSSYVLELEAEGDDVCVLPETQTKKLSGSMAEALIILRDMYCEYEKI